ncbi:unnamed protein product [Taenia asiatica]|uniref:Uncharacterized protein n=1 Tax=Taenia asiatica TaxID=60517 RepID=A0A0R3VY25_TAEAS|nr:unnamed protein product [Taenia asiatica]
MIKIMMMMTVLDRKEAKTEDCKKTDVNTGVKKRPVDLGSVQWVCNVPARIVVAFLGFEEVGGIVHEHHMPITASGNNEAALMPCRDGGEERIVTCGGEHLAM